MQPTPIHDEEAIGMNVQAELSRIMETQVSRFAKDPFAEGQAAARCHYGAVIECPYSGSDYQSTYDRREWLNGYYSVARI